MADAGYSADKKLASQMIKTGKLLVIHPTDCPIATDIKTRLNALVLNDVAQNRSYNGHSYIWHSAYTAVSRTLVKINQLRMQNWYWMKFSL